MFPPKTNLTACPEDDRTRRLPPQGARVVPTEHHKPFLLQDRKIFHIMRIITADKGLFIIFLPIYEQFFRFKTNIKINRAQAKTF